jgi:hypothetical protein
MKLGLYTFSALSLIGLVGAITYAINPNHYIVEIMGINFNFPVALWVILPMLLLLLLTLLYMMFYGLKNYFLLKKWEKDTETLENAFYWSLVNEPKEQKYAISQLRSSAVLLSKASLSVSDNIEGLTPRLSRIVNMIQKIKNGEYVDLKEEKMLKVFKPGNPILIHNRLNGLKSDEKLVEEVMRSTTDYSDEVQKEALSIFSHKENFEKARKYIRIFDVKNFLVMLNRVTQEDDLGLNKDILTEFVENLKLSCRDFVNIAAVTKKYFKPDENLALFNMYQKENDKAQTAYLYLLFEYELIDQIGAYLEEHEDNEFVKFRALYQLKRQNSKYKLDDLIDISTVCNETKFL